MINIQYNIYDSTIYKFYHFDICQEKFRNKNYIRVPVKIS